jgi:hypothetical protein
MDFNQLETRLRGSRSRFSESRNNALDTGFRQRRGLRVCVGKWLSARSVDLAPAPFINRSSFSAFPWPARAGLSPRMGNLNRGHASLTLNKARSRS